MYLACKLLRNGIQQHKEIKCDCILARDPHNCMIGACAALSLSLSLVQLSYTTLADDEIEPSSHLHHLLLHCLLLTGACIGAIYITILIILYQNAEQFAIKIVLYQQCAIVLLLTS